MSALAHGAESLYFAQPYRIGAQGFYFTDLDDYAAKAALARDDDGQPLEEFEIQYIDGNDAELFEAVRVNQANLHQWFELVAEAGSDEDRSLVAIHLAGLGYPMTEIADKLDDYSVYHGSAADYAEEYVRDCFQLPEGIAGYIDYELLGRDLELEGALTVLRHDKLIVGG